MSPRGGAAGSAAVMAAGTLVSRVLGQVKAILLIVAVGATTAKVAGGAADAFALANNLPNVLYMLIAGGVLNAVLVPQIVRAMRSADGGQAYVNKLLTAAGSLLLLLTAILTAASSLVLVLYGGSGKGSEWWPLAVAFTYLCLPQIFFYGLYTLFGQVLNARSNFGPYMWAPTVNNIVSIAGLVAYLVVYGQFDPTNPSTPADWDTTRVLVLAGTATLGVAAQALILIVPMWRSGFRYKPDFRIRGVGLGSASKVATWAFAALAVGQLGYLAVSNINYAAVKVGEAGTAVYQNAFLVFMLPQSLITVSLVTAIFTRLSGHAAAGAGAKVRDDLSMGLRTLAVFTVFASGAMMTLAVPIVGVVFVGKTGWELQQAIAAALVAFSAGLVSIGAWTMVQRVYYAYEDTRSLFRFQVPMMAVQVVVILAAWIFLPPSWWVISTGVATTLSNSVGAFVAYLALRRKLPSLDGSRVFRTHLRLVLATLPMAAIGWGLLHLWGVGPGLWRNLAQTLAIGALMTVGYLLLVRRLQVRELDALASRVGSILAPITRRLAPVLARIPGLGAVRTMVLSSGTTSSGGGAVADATHPPLEVGDTVAERYRLVELERSDLPGATVWRGEDEILGRPVRLTAYTGANREAALDAARRAALVHDPRLPRVHRVGTDAGRGYVVTAWAPGRTLAQAVAAEPLDAAAARAVVGEAATALEAARRRGVRHLAIRPEAILLTDNGQVQVTGLAADGALLGKDGLDATAAGRADAVALVQVLYAAMTGTWPGAPELAGGLTQAPEGGPVPLGDLDAQAPADLDTLASVTLSGHDDGPFTPGELVRDLAPWEDLADLLPHAAAPAAPAAAPVAPVVMAEDPQTGEMSAVPAPLDTSRWTPHAGETLESGTAETASFDALIESDGSTDALPARHGRAAVTAAVPDEAAATHVALPAVPDAAPAEPDGGPEPEAAEATRVRPVVDAPFDQEAPAPRADVPGAPAAASTAAPAATDWAGSGWDVPAGAGEADVRVGTPRANAPQQGGDTSTFGPEQPRTFPQVVRPDAAAPAPAGPEAEEDPIDQALALGGAGFGTPVPERVSRLGRVRGPGGIADTASRAGEAAGDLGRRAGAFAEEVADQFRPVDEDEHHRKRFNPAPWVLLAMLALVVFGLFLAVQTLMGAKDAKPPAATTAPPAAATTEPAAEQPPAEQPPAEEPPVAVPAVIADVQTFDPIAPGGESQDQAYRMFDGNPDTLWKSKYYKTQNFGGLKSGLGLVITLQQATTITDVKVTVLGQGGLIQVRNDPNNPEGGDVLAEAPMGHDTVLTLSAPVETDKLVLWIPSLPTADDGGRFRIDIAEITLN